MNSLICPISTEKVNSSVVRITGFLVATTVAAFILTGNIFFIAFLFIDFTIRAFTTLKISPYSWLAAKLASGLGLAPKMIDKAPKLFASRVGFVFSLAALLLFYASPVASIVVASILMACALLESLFDFCVGCVVYTYIVLPLNKKR